MADLYFKNVSKKYDNSKTYSVCTFNLEIKDEEFIVLIGPSGCGKSTLLRMIAGLEEITSGEIYIDQRKVNDVEPKDRDISMVFQNYALYPHMTVYDNMAFSLKLRKINKKKIEEEVGKAAKILEIEDFLKRKPKELSGGQRQRVALGRAIVRNPKVFLMDEPLSNLDAKLRVQTRAEIVKLHKELGTTFIYVTHDQIEAMTMADRIVIMNEGVIQQVGTPKEVYTNPANIFVASFIGSPQMNFKNGTIVEKEYDLYFKSNDFELIINKEQSNILKSKGYLGKDVVFGIRPEHIKINSKYPDNKIKCKLELVESLGYEAYLHLSLGQSKFISKVEVWDEEIEKEEIDVFFNNQAFYFFDPKTEKNLI